MKKRLALRTLRISESQRSLAFYRDFLAMNLVAECETADAGAGEQQTHYFLGFDATQKSPIGAADDWLASEPTLLELVHQPTHPSPLNTALNSNRQSRYWKIGITLANVDIARAKLMAAVIEVEPARQFLDAGYLCHLTDPDGYCIELLQHYVTGEVEATLILRVSRPIFLARN